MILDELVKVGCFNELKSINAKYTSIMEKLNGPEQEEYIFDSATASKMFYNSIIRAHPEVKKFHISGFHSLFR